MTLRKLTLAALAVGMMTAAAAEPALAAEEKKADPNKEQFIPILVYRTGPFAAGGTGIPGGMMDYFELLNQRDGGINGIKLVWEECDTGYKTDRGVECYERLKKNGAKGAPFQAEPPGAARQLVRGDRTRQSRPSASRGGRLLW